jgi:soluble lytic murein transglycosylase
MLRRRLRIVVVLAAIGGVIAGIALTAKVRPERRLPLEDQTAIKAQAKQKQLDPALIAAVIYAETKFVPRESSAGAEGLMQILPSTAEFLAKRSGGTEFSTADLAHPEVNIAYGSYYLRYLLNHYGGEELPTIAAYNAGLTNVDRWVAKAKEEGKSLSVDEIPFPETRAYVKRVLGAEQAYRRLYPKQLGME